MGPQILLLLAVATVGVFHTCVASSATAERIHLGPLERHGEVVSGAFIAAVGLVFLVWTRW